MEQERKKYVRIKLKSNSIHTYSEKSHVMSRFPSHEPKNNKPSNGTNQTHTYTLIQYKLLLADFILQICHACCTHMGKQQVQKKILPLICPSTLKPNIRSAWQPKMECLLDRILRRLQHIFIPVVTMRINAKNELSSLNTATNNSYWKLTRGNLFTMKNPRHKWT